MLIRAFRIFSILRDIYVLLFKLNICNFQISGNYVFVAILNGAFHADIISAYYTVITQPFEMIVCSTAKATTLIVRTVIINRKIIDSSCNWYQWVKLRTNSAGRFYFFIGSIYNCFKVPIFFLVFQNTWLNVLSGTWIADSIIIRITTKEISIA